MLPNKEDDLSYDDLSKLDFVERCLKETMRLFPTVPVVARKVDINFQLNGEPLGGDSIHNSPLSG